MPTVSVLMPAFNVEPYLAESVESVLAQTYRDVELVIVDDGSTDGTLAVARRLRAAHPERIVVVSQANRGLAGARNTAIAASRGRVLALLDSDDVWMPTFLEEQMRILETDPAIAIVTGNALNRGGPNDGSPVHPVDDHRPPPNLLEILRDETAVFIMSVFRREVVARIGGFDERFRTNEDYDFWIRAGLAGFGFARNSWPLGLYRRHPNSLSASEQRMVAGILRVYRKTWPRCPPGSPEQAACEQQIVRFEIEALRINVRAALRGHDATSASRAIGELWRRDRRLVLAVAAAVIGVAPGVALWAYRVCGPLRALSSRVRLT